MHDRRALLYGLVSAVALFIGLMGISTVSGSAARGGGVTIAEIAATPAIISPIDVLTIRTTVANDGMTVDDLTVRMVVWDASGQAVLQERQSGVGLDSRDRRAVYWVWRIPDRLSDGAYGIEMVVLDRNSNLLARASLDTAFVVAHRYAAKPAER